MLPRSRMMFLLAFGFCLIAAVHSYAIHQIPQAPQTPPLEHPRQPPLPPQLEQPQLPPNTDSEDILSLIENQLHAIDTKDYETAYNNYSASMFRGTTNFEEFKYFVTGYTIFTKNKNAVFGNLQIKKDKATIQGTLTSTEGESHKVQYYLIKEGNLWKIAGIQVNRTPEFAPPEKHEQPYDFQADIE